MDTSTTFEEKSAVISLVSVLAVFGFYSLIAGNMLAEGVTSATPYLPIFLGAALLLVVIQVVSHIAAAIAFNPEDRDERDILISWRAENNSSWVLGVAVLAAVVSLALNIPGGWIANGLLFGLFLAEIIKSALRLYYYRWGM